MGRVTEQKKCIGHSDKRVAGLTGATFGRLTITGNFVQKPKGIYVTCNCTCGTEKQFALSKVLIGHTKSCGCLQQEQLRQRQTIHGHYYEVEFRAWVNMKKRCSAARYAKWYGNVQICEQWLNSYETFVRDVGRRPDKSYSLDRIDFTKGYFPDNVRWASKAVQSRNTKVHCTSKTNVKGVSWSNAKNKWRAAIYVANKQKHIGYFTEFNAAVTARKNAELKFWGN